jgi:hypothetical protein
MHCQVPTLFGERLTPPRKITPAKTDPPQSSRRCGLYLAVQGSTRCPAKSAARLELTYWFFGTDAALNRSRSSRLSTLPRFHASTTLCQTLAETEDLSICTPERFDPFIPSFYLSASRKVLARAVSFKPSPPIPVQGIKEKGSTGCSDSPPAGSIIF